jgi:hypothetical protein
MEGITQSVRGNDLRAVATCRLAEVDAFTDLESLLMISCGHGGPTIVEPR